MCCRCLPVAEEGAKGEAELAVLMTRNLDRSSGAAA
jgi:hypothetical protein